MPKKLFIKTYGCQMNVYDSSRMAELLAPLGYSTTDRPEGADMVILNTCHIREKAAEKVYSELGRLRVMKETAAAEGGRMTLAVAGCVAQAEGAELMARAPAVDLVVGPQSYHRLPELLARAERSQGGVLATDFPVESKFDHLPAARKVEGGAAFLSVQEGCDKFCTFCVVPYTRGAESSRPVAAVLREAEQLIAAGALEITLLGQNVNAYHGLGLDGESWGLAKLLRAVAALPGLKRLRYTTSHPRDFDDALIAAHGEIEQLMPFMHLPVQSGSDAILEAMNRRHKIDDYRRALEKLRHARPDIALSSDFIVGFPGESEADFAATLALVADVGFAQAYSFKFSARPGTPASVLPGQLSEEVKNERLVRLQAAVAAEQRRFNETTVGTLQEVLLERPGRKKGQLIGRSPFMQSVHLVAPAHRIGRLAQVEILEAHPMSLAGRLAEAPRAKRPLRRAAGAAA